MYKTLLALMFVCALFTATNAQKIAKPTLKATETTQAQKEAIGIGIAHHDAGRYAEAIKAYKQVLDENPSSTLALYELAMTYYKAKDAEKAIETAVQGSKYRSEHLPLFYLVIANVIDDTGKSKEAVKIYRDAIKFLKDDAEMRAHLSSVYYNLSVSYVRQKSYTEARAELKNAVEANYAYASPHALLGEVFLGTKYKMPAWLAAGRFISLEFNTQRSKRASEIITGLMRPASKDEKTGNTVINLDFGAPTDEGDFGIFELLLPTMGIINNETKEGEEKLTVEGSFVKSVDSVIAMLEEDEKLRKTFVGKAYIPFFSDMKKKGYTPLFAHMVLFRSGNENALEYLSKNEAKLVEFLGWAKAYQLKK